MVKRKACVFISGTGTNLLSIIKFLEELRTNNVDKRIKILKETYSSSIGVEFLHIQSP